MRMPDLNRKLVLESAVRTADGAGGYDTVWTALGEVWGRVRAGTGRDAAVAGLAQGQVSYRITLRAAPVGTPRRPLPGQRLVEGTRIYRVLAVADNEDARFLTVHARDEEVAA